MLEKLDERDADAKRTTKIQLWIAVGAVLVSALLAGASFVQDRSNNDSGDKWQAAVLSELKTSNERGTSNQTENQLFRNEMQRLAATVAELEGRGSARSNETKQDAQDRKKMRRGPDDMTKSTKSQPRKVGFFKFGAPRESNSAPTDYESAAVAGHEPETSYFTPMRCTFSSWEK